MKVNWLTNNKDYIPGILYYKQINLKPVYDLNNSKWYLSTVPSLQTNWWSEQSCVANPEK